MKREVFSTATSNAESASDDWRSGAAAILDNIDDVLWDELRELSPPHTPRSRSHLDVIRGASPVNSPNAHVQTLSQHDRGGISPICGDSPIRCNITPTHTLRHQSSMPLGDGDEGLGFSFGTQLDAMWTSGVAVPPAASTAHIEVDGPRWAQQFQQPSLGGEEVLRMQLDKMDELDASEELGYHALSDLDLTHVILENQRTIGRVQSRLFVPSSLDTEGGTRTRRMQTFGWDMVQRVDGNIMECVFTKKFHGLNVAGLMQKTWANDMRLGEFKKVKGETCRLEVLQQVNPNAYVLCRDVMSPTQDISIFRSVFVRFLIETSKKIPASSGVSSFGTGIDASAPSTPPQYAESDSDCEELMLEATGYVLGTQSVDTDHSRHPRAEDMFNKVAWAHLSLSIEFLNVVNPVTGEEYQQLCWSGRTNYCGPEHAQRNASDMLQGMLRWELVVISPALNLVSLSLE
ncbi:hypothetical protein BBO99_00001319 [Phytophthora kernoviae]|uniref:Uncharacterized protein n=1 Tax=Phytophthora kernoviae TaxID=325452 RepID=A0A3R7FY98_9STRA|nr:hypothetical protein BBI17_001192 [Phytophthora kernoviae]RLN84393.1 hypothetical protein BBO99_00001319 [Phytophthora kernoviae]